jgi:hypothetical protein
VQELYYPPYTAVPYDGNARPKVITGNHELLVRK